MRDSRHADDRDFHATGCAKGRNLMDTEPSEHPNQSLERIIRRRAPWILLCLVLAAGAAYGYSKHKTKEYTATAVLSFSNNTLSEQIAGLSGSGSSGSGLLAQENSDRELVRSGDAAAKTASLLGHGLTAEQVSANVSVGGPTESTSVDVSATSTSPRLAAAIANTYADQFVTEQHSANKQFFGSALALVKRQLASLAPVQRYGSDGLDLQDRAHTLGLLADLGYNNAEVIQEALIPSSPSSPKVSRNTILGAVLGLLIGLAVAFVLERLDRRIREPEDLEAIYDLPMLGVVPKSTALGERRAALPPAEAEAFSLIRAHLRFFNIDHDLRTVVVASAAPGEGKSTIARHLAEAAARSGSRVLLLELDLRQPTLAQQLDIQPGPGLAGVLIGAISMDDATQPVAVETPPGEGATGRTLDVLVAGAVLPPNPGELIESHAMGVVLARARSTYDYVVIDTSPLTVVSDAFPLLTKVDGVVIVGRIGHSRRDSAQELHHVLASSGAPLLGIIVNHSKSAGSYPYSAASKSAGAVVSADLSSSARDFAPTVKP
jgi:polysaccharide biosynthesis transport protein